VFPGIRLTKSEARLLPKRHPFSGGEGKEVQAPLTHLSGKVLAWLLLPKRVFKCQFLYVWKSFGEVGLSQLLCVHWLLAWNDVSSQTGLSSLTQLWSGYLCMCFQGPSVLYPKQSLVPHRSLDLQWWAIPPYFCLTTYMQVNCSLS